MGVPEIRFLFSCILELIIARGRMLAELSVKTNGVDPD